MHSLKQCLSSWPSILKIMELRERNYRSRLGSKRSTKARREGEYEDSSDRSRPMTDREKFSITNNVPRNHVDYGHIIKKWAPLAIVAAVVWWVISNYFF
jgi:hypothetical protein